MVSTADLIFVFGSAAEVRDHLKNVKDSIKDRLIVPVTEEGQLDTFQVNSDTGDSGVFLVSIDGPLGGEGIGGRHWTAGCCWQPWATILLGPTLHASSSPLGSWPALCWQCLGQHTCFGK